MYRLDVCMFEFTASSTTKTSILTKVVVAEIVRHCWRQYFVGEGPAADAGEMVLGKFAKKQQNFVGLERRVLLKQSYWS